MTKDNRFHGNVSKVFCNDSMIYRYDRFGNHLFGKQSFDNFGNLIYDYYSYEPTFMGEPTEDFEYKKNYYLYNCHNVLLEKITYISKQEAVREDGMTLYDAYQRRLITKYSYYGKIPHKEITYSGDNIISSIEYKYHRKKIKTRCQEFYTELLMTKTFHEKDGTEKVYEYEYDDFGHKIKFNEIINGIIKKTVAYEYSNNLLVKEIYESNIIEYSEFDAHSNYQLKTTHFKSGCTKIEKFKYEYFK